ncbi:MAG TPA: chromate transporter, partial [Burkholderiales bacterium]|nr:chromate transporter [Burkholderiales bacterium]
MTTSSGVFQDRWKEVAAVFLKLGAMSYGGSAMLGIMQAEIAERRQWLTNERYLVGVGLVNMLPGPPAVQLAIFIGYNRCGWRGGILAGLCFMLPAFLILLG